MNAVGKLGLGPVPEWQKARLARWLHEWQIEQVLRAVPRDDLEGTKEDERPSVKLAPDLEAAPTDDEPTLARGQVRLLSPEVSGAGDLPVYVAILDVDEHDRPLAVPFSRFAEPGLPGELETGITARPLRVLCLWNARRLPHATLSKSWLAAGLAAPETETLASACQCVNSGEPLPAELLTRTGPPLVHPDDPRHIYRARESMRMDRIAGTQVTYLLHEAEQRDLPLAAEDGPEYDAEQDDDCRDNPS